VDDLKARPPHLAGSTAYLRISAQSGRTHTFPHSHVASQDLWTATSRRLLLHPLLFLRFRALQHLSPTRFSLRDGHRHRPLAAPISRRRTKFTISYFILTL
jgi:hypothetical protein